MGAAAPTDGKRVLSAAGSPEGSRPFGKVSPQGRWEFPGKLPYLVWHISPRLNALLRCAGHFKAWAEGTLNPVKESEITMASVEKFSAGAVRNQLRHNRREIEHSGNPDIDPSRQGQDYVLSPDRGMTEYDYFLQRKSELYCYNRDDVKVMAGWVVTAPQDLDPERYDDFFCATYDFLANRYGEENVVQAIVHDDEGGQPHLHFCFVPVAEDPKHEQGYKICANDVLDRRELRNFHPDLQHYLDAHGLEDARVMTGVTKRQGGNRSVAQLKAEREQEYQQEVERPALYFGESSGLELHF